MDKLLNSNKDDLSIQKMILIYNAVMDGWTVTKKQENNFIFKKNKEDIVKEVELDKDYLKYFIKNNLKINF